ncbi:uncharacterized protein LOC122557359 [Chiloscyllium plagiosum]|uniref:uncharacterized protein LOC122557359 n=1 Tax=Chiloscyllium plagiosum TaxID=36176 RepID=UPI001CB7E4A9|nr:uncharacterized protein LOC122557359 [Chiloscyllium plagiosum]
MIFDFSLTWNSQNLKPFQDMINKYFSASKSLSENLREGTDLFETTKRTSGFTFLRSILNYVSSYSGLPAQRYQMQDYLRFLFRSPMQNRELKQQPHGRGPMINHKGTGSADMSGHIICKNVAWLYISLQVTEGEADARNGKNQTNCSDHPCLGILDRKLCANNEEVFSATVSLFCFGYNWLLHDLSRQEVQPHKTWTCWAEGPVSTFGTQ